MTRAQTFLYRARHVLWAAAVVLFVGGAVAIVFLLVDRDRLADRLAREADLRGEAVSTLAGDVRALREQVKAEGATPVAPDPTRAVEDLPDRAEVPVPIPGPRGAQGEKGERGEPGPAVTGPSGAPGEPGADSTVPGPQGPRGEPGADSTIPGPSGPPGDDGRDGVDGRDGQTCPDGYSLQAPSYDPDALVCRRDGAADPGPGEGKGSLAEGALDPLRRQYV